ncbi:MAG TPA: hypothetical protein VFV01_10015 [Spirillospora sp.]|nr:hypothetical protein [Spirillospora sp.]
MSARRRDHPLGWYTNDPSWKRLQWDKPEPAPEQCSAPGCRRPRRVRGWCRRHYQRWRRALPRPLDPAPVPAALHAAVVAEMRAAYAECARALGEAV